MTKILALSGSNRKQSINHALLNILTRDLDRVTLNSITQYQAPLYNLDDEEETGIPTAITQFVDAIKAFDALIISTPEHNGNLPVSLKNVLDWASRVDNQFLANKKVLVLSTSPGARGGIGANQTLAAMLPFFGAEVIGSVAVSSFYDAVDQKSHTLKDPEKKEEITSLITSL